MTSRAQFSTELRAAIGRILVGRTEVSLSEIETALPAGFDAPGRVTLAKAVTALGWAKAQRPGSGGALYRSPSWRPRV